MALSRLVWLPNGLSKTFWSRYRGKRGGSLVKSGENDPCHLISVAQPRDLNRVSKLPRLHRFRNLANLISVNNRRFEDRLRSIFFISNLLSLSKIDQLRHANLDCICITKSWLRSHIHDNLVALEGLISSAGTELNLNTVLDDLEDPSFEMFWAKLRPAGLLRGCNSIVVGTLYHPWSATDPAIMEYLMKCSSTIESCYPNCAILIAGDFNRLQITRLRNNFQLSEANSPLSNSRQKDTRFTPY